MLINKTLDNWNKFGWDQITPNKNYIRNICVQNCGQILPSETFLKGVSGLMEGRAMGNSGDGKFILINDVVYAINDIKDGLDDSMTLDNGNDIQKAMEKGKLFVGKLSLWEELDILTNLQENILADDLLKSFLTKVSVTLDLINLVKEGTLHLCPISSGRNESHIEISVLDGPYVVKECGDNSHIHVGDKKYFYKFSEIKEYLTKGVLHKNPQRFYRDKSR